MENINDFRFASQWDAEHFADWLAARDDDVAYEVGYVNVGDGEGYWIVEATEDA